jgi:Zn-dependent M28 family amino/carboxypeptidase
MRRSGNTDILKVEVPIVGERTVSSQSTKPAIGFWRDGSRITLEDTIFGAAEPRLRPLTAAHAERLPEKMAAADALVLESLTAAGWAAEARTFEVSGVTAWADAYNEGRVQHADRLRGVNIVAVKEGTDTRDALAVVAHHDTVPGTGGADDNGSGVAGLLELARLLAPVPLRRSVVLAAVGHEELGFLGSRQLVQELSADRRVLGAVVYEMLAYTSGEPGSQQLPPRIGAVYRGQAGRVARNGARGDFTTVIYQQRSRGLATCLAECLAHQTGPAATMLLRAPADLPLIGPLLARALPFVRDFARSDHVPFWDAGLAAVQVTDTANFRNPHYHRAGDTPETLDYERLADVIAATALAVERLAG